MKKQNALRVYLIVNFCMAVFYLMGHVVKSLYRIQTAEFTPLQLILVGTMLEGTVFIFEIPTGIIADVSSRRLSTIIGMFIIGAAFILEGSIATFGMILLAQFLWGLGHTFTSGALDAWISDEVGEQNAALAFVRGAKYSQIGSFAGIVLGVLLGYQYINIPLTLSGVGFLILGIYLVLKMPEEKFTPAASAKRSSWQNMAHTVENAFKMVRRRPALGDILIIGLFFGLYSEGLDRLWQLHFLEQFSFGAIKPVVLFGAFEAVSMLVSAGALSILQGRINLAGSRMLIKAQTWITAGMLLMFYAFTWLQALIPALIAYMLLTLFREIRYPVYRSWVNHRLDSSVRATMLSVSGQMDSLGQITGGPGIGLIAERYSVRTALTVSASLLLPVFYFFARQFKLDEDNNAVSPTES